MRLKHWLTEWIDYLWLCIVTSPRGSIKKTTVVGNRSIYTGQVGPFEVTTTFRNTKEEDGYSREELYSLLKLIRREEERHQWKVPEPKEF